MKNREKKREKKRERSPYEVNKRTDQQSALGGLPGSVRRTQKEASQIESLKF